MKVTKEEGDYRFSVYQPDEDEKRLIGETSDKIIKVIEEANLTDDQEIHLISSLYSVMKEIHNIKGMKHFTGDGENE